MNQHRRHWHAGNVGAGIEQETIGRCATLKPVLDFKAQAFGAQSPQAGKARINRQSDDPATSGFVDATDISRARTGGIGGNHHETRAEVLRKISLSATVPLIVIPYLTVMDRRGSFGVRHITLLHQGIDDPVVWTL